MKTFFRTKTFQDRMFVKVNSFVGLVKAIRCPRCIKAEVVNRNEFYVTLKVKMPA